MDNGTGGGNGGSTGSNNDNNQNNLNFNQNGNNLNNNPFNVPPQFQVQIPTNFDLNSLSPADRENFLRRLQQQQLQRARQAQQAAQNYQRMTMNAYSTPRPPLGQSSSSTTTATPGQQFFINPMNSINPINPINPINQMNQINPMMISPNLQHLQNMQMSQQQAQMGFPMGRQQIPMTGINPALLQQQGVKPPQQPQISHIYPQQFTNPLKSDPVLFNGPQSQQGALNVPPFDEQVLSSEGNFVDHLIKFYEAIKFSNRSIPQIANRPVSLFKLFQIVNSAGGFMSVGENKKWPLVTQALQLPPQNVDVVSTVRVTYYTFLYSYEQYFIQKRPLDKIEWPNQTRSQPQSQQPSLNLPVKQPAIPPQIPANVPLNPQQLKFIPENDLSLWKPFSDAMKTQIGPITDLDSAIIYLKSPYITLRIEALLATQKLFAIGNPKELQTAGISSGTLSALLESLENIWIDAVSKLPVKENKHKIMEEFWTDSDLKQRNIFDFEEEGRDLMICKCIVNLLRTLSVTRGPDVLQLLAKSDFIKTKLLPFSLMESNDLEIYKDSLVIFEAISPLLTIDKSLLTWTLEQTRMELRQVRRERLLGLAAKFFGSINLDKIGSFENLTLARQSVSNLITQCAQLWKTVPPHIFLHLSTCLSILTSCDTLSIDLKDFAIEIEAFFNLFVLPTVSLLRSIKGLYECTISTSNSAEELRRILETVFYSPAFSLTDGGFLELCLQILSKCQGHQSDSLLHLNWNSMIILLRELREFWRHSHTDLVPNLGKSCYQGPNMVTGSPVKKSTTTTTSKQPLAILNGSNNIAATFSHPFLLLHKSLNLLAVNFLILPDSIKLDLLELSVEWNLMTPSKWGKEVLGNERIEDSLKLIREHLIN